MRRLEFTFGTGFHQHILVVMALSVWVELVMVENGSAVSLETVMRETEVSMPAKSLEKTLAIAAVVKKAVEGAVDASCIPSASGMTFHSRRKLLTELDAQCMHLIPLFLVYQKHPMLPMSP